MTLTEGDAVLNHPLAKRGRHRGGRGKRDKRKKRGRALRQIVPMMKAAGVRNPARAKGTWV